MVAMTSVEWLVMDECDRLFEDGKNGFKTELGIIYRYCLLNFYKRISCLRDWRLSASGGPN